VEIPAQASRILVVEDDAGIRETLVECLASEGYAVETASNGAEGLERVRRGRFDVVVLDLVMPIVNGAEFLEATGRDPGLREVPVLLMTAAMPSPRGSFPRAAAYLAKPFELGELLDTVERLCRTRGR
jgi:two-component system chemotaxis response regulator CheY